MSLKLKLVYYSEKVRDREELTSMSESAQQRKTLTPTLRNPGARVHVKLDEYLFMVLLSSDVCSENTVTHRYQGVVLQ